MMSRKLGDKARRGEKKRLGSASRWISFPPGRFRGNSDKSNQTISKVGKSLGTG